VRPLAVLLAAGLLLTACGEAPRPVAEVRVKLKLDLPSEGASIRDDQVEVGAHSVEHVGDRGRDVRQLALVVPATPAVEESHAGA